MTTHKIDNISNADSETLADIAETKKRVAFTILLSSVIGFVLAIVLLALGHWVGLLPLV